MIRQGTKEVRAIRLGRRMALEVRKGALTAWRLLSGLFASRMWLRGKSWTKGNYWLTK